MSSNSVSSELKTRETVFPDSAIVVPPATSSNSIPTISIPNPVTNQDDDGDTADTTVDDETFEICFKEFIEFSSETLRYYMNDNLSVDKAGGNEIIKKKLDAYYKLFMKTKHLPGHVRECQRIWKACQSHLKRDYETKEVDIASFTDWFTKAALTITPSVDNPQSAIKVSIIYNNCLRIVQRIESEVKKAEETGDVEQVKRLYAYSANSYPEKFLYLLFRCFQFSIDGDKVVKNPTDILTEAIQILLEDIQPKGGESFDDSGFDGLFSMVREFGNATGLNLPPIPTGPNGEAFNAKTLKTGMQRLKTDPQAKQQVQRAFASLGMKDMDPSDPNLFAKAIGKFMTQMGNQPMPDALIRAQNATVENPTGESTEQSATQSNAMTIKK